MELSDISTLNPGLGDWAILKAYRGSVAHGMYVPNTDPNSIDDVDLISICVPDIEYYMGLREYGSRGTKEIFRDQFDVVIYEARKAIRLLAQGNPNAMSLLWLEKEHYLNITPAGQILLDNRDAFVGKHVFKPFVGYANSQLYRMTHGSYQGYMGEKRKKIVDQFGYDVKNAAHLIRLLRMGIEFLHDGYMTVKRPDAQELLTIKRGSWTLEAVKAEADRLFTEIMAALDKSTLPVAPDMDTVNQLAVSVIHKHLSISGQL